MDAPSRTRGRWQALTAAPHRTLFLAGMINLLIGSLWWALHLFARYYGFPSPALDVAVAPIWAHSFLMLFAILPTFFFGFLFTTFPRWMNGPQVPPSTYTATAILMTAGTVAWHLGTHGSPSLLLLGCALAGLGLLLGTVALLGVLLNAVNVVSHAIVCLVALWIGIVSLAGFTYGVAGSNDFALHFAVRSALWGLLLPVFFAVSHRMIGFFSQNAVPGYVAWRPLWILVAVVALAYARLLLGTAGALTVLVLADAALFVLTAICAVRWTSFSARGNPLLWTLYVGFAWLPLAMLLQTVRDLGFVTTGQWWLGRAPIHALGVGYFGGMLLAMVTRVTMGHSGQALRMDRLTLACFIALQLAAVSRVLSEVSTSPAGIKWLLLGSVSLWLAAVAAWTVRYAGVYLRPRADGRPG
jgi:uncharacterized protein involved in response to NO